jgi:aarF domain-containing kinase
MRVKVILLTVGTFLWPNVLCFLPSSPLSSPRVAYRAVSVNDDIQVAVRKEGKEIDSITQRYVDSDNSDIDTTTKRASQQDEGALSVMDKLARTSRFYSQAIPVFLAYQFLERKLKFERDVLGKSISDEEEEQEWDRLHEWGSDIMSETISELKGFYVKTGQIISTRVDIFPVQYTSKLSTLQDSLDPLPFSAVKDVIRKELLDLDSDSDDLSDLFLSFDEKPLGSASIAQVHKAVLLDGRTVAVKIQRPGISQKLLSDISNIINFAQVVDDVVPIDYYKVFCELERTLIDELDFFREAQATQKIAAAVAHTPRNKQGKQHVLVPLPIPGLVTKKVMVMQFVEGQALSQLAKSMENSGVAPGSPESLLFGRKLLGSLTDAYSHMIFGSGIIHGDPHPGNIFVTESKEICLLDCGQFKQINTRVRVKLADLICTVQQYEILRTESETLAAGGRTTSDRTAQDVQKDLESLITTLAKSVRSFGVKFREGVPDSAPAAVALLLFGNTGVPLPGGYAYEEISPDSPVAEVIEFPQEFVLLGRATVMIKGIAARLGMPWCLSDRWAPVARECLEADAVERLPVWSAAVPPETQVDRAGVLGRRTKSLGSAEGLRFRDVLMSLNLSRTWNLLGRYMNNKIGKTMLALLKFNWFRSLSSWVLKIPNRDAGGMKKTDVIKVEAKAVSVTQNLEQ